MLLSKEIIEKLAAQLLTRQVGSACEAVGVSLGSYYRWHWESRRLSRRRVPNVVDTPYETLLREFSRMTRKSRKRYLARKQRARVKKTTSEKRALSVRASRKEVLDLCKETTSLTSADFDFKEKVV